MAVGSGQWRNWAPVAKSKLAAGEGRDRKGTGQEPHSTPLPKCLLCNFKEGPGAGAGWGVGGGVARACLAMNLLAR